MARLITNSPGIITIPARQEESVDTELAVYRESHIRSLLKAFSWRIVATLTTGIIAYFVTGEIGTAVLIGGVEFVLKFFIYYLHERAWQLLPRGSIRHWFGREVEPADSN
jgi:uncharacterized membrane protein